MAIPFLNNINLSDNELQNVKLHVTGTAPTNAAGQIYYDSSLNVARYHNNDGWVRVTDTSLTSGTFVNTTLSGTNAEKSYAVDLSATGTADSSTFLRGDNTWAVVVQENDSLTGLSFNTADGILTATVSNQSDVTVDLDGRYALVGDIPTVNDATLTVQGTGVLGGTGTFTANDADNTTISISHDNTSRTDTISTDTPGYGGTFEAVTGVTTNATGHVTAVNVSTVTIPDSDDTTYNISVGAGGANSSTIDLNAGGAGSGTDSITLQGTDNGITITESGDAITVGLQSDIIVDNLTVNNNVSITGNLEVTGTFTTVNETVKVIENNTIEFEGTTDNEFEIKLNGGDPTADHTVVLPDASGTIAITSDIPRGAASTITGDSTFVHALGDDIIVQLFDTVTGETVFADIIRRGTDFRIEFASTPVNPVRVLVQEIISYF